MAIVEIRTEDGVLLAGRPGQIPAIAVRIGDRQSLDARLRRLPTDRWALHQLRRRWRVLGMGISSTALDDNEMVTLLSRRIAAGQIEAVYLRDGPPPAPVAPEQPDTANVLHVQLPGMTVLIAAKGHLPPEFRSQSNPQQAAAIIRQIGHGTPQAKAIDLHASRLPGGTVKNTTGAPLRQHIVHQLERGGHDAVVLTHPAAVAQAAARPDAPKPVSAMSENERIGAALKQSLPYAVEEGGEEIRKVVEEMLKPESIALMIAMAAGIALANLNPVSALVVDTTLLALAWWNGGNEAIAGITAFAMATLDARDATSDEELDKAARAYGKALGAMGPKFLGAIFSRFKTKSGGAGGKGGKSAGSGKSGKADAGGRNPQENRLAPPNKAALALAARQAALLRKGVDQKTLSLLKNEKQLAAFEKALDEIDKLDLSKMNGRDTIFYSGKTHGKPSWQVAEQMAKDKKMNVISNVSDNILNKSRASVPSKAMNFLDIRLSRKMAENASGNIKVVGDPRTMNVETGVFYKEELPRLLKNPNISPESREDLQRLKQILDAKARAIEEAKAAGRSLPFNSVF